MTTDTPQNKPRPIEFDSIRPEDFPAPRPVVPLRMLPNPSIDPRLQATSDLYARRILGEWTA